MVCPKCGNNLPKDSRFCQYCGEKVNHQSQKGFQRVSSILFLVLLATTIIIDYSYLNALKNIKTLSSANENLENTIEDLQETSTDYQEEIDSLKKTLKDREAVLSEARTRVGYFERNIGFITENDDRYHTIYCPYYDDSVTWWAHNIEYCEYLGYSECLICH